MEPYDLYDHGRYLEETFNATTATCGGTTTWTEIEVQYAVGAIVIVILFLSIFFEFGKDFVLESVAPEMRAPIQHVFGEVKSYARHRQRSIKKDDVKRSLAYSRTASRHSACVCARDCQITVLGFVSLVLFCLESSDVMAELSDATLGSPDKLEDVFEVETVASTGSGASNVSR
jgi:hypothetical protein